MPNFNIITSMFNLPQESLTLIDHSTLLLQLPVTVHHCPRCNCLTSAIHAYRKQPIKSIALKSIGFSLVYRKRRYICSSCSKTFFEDNFFLSPYQRMTKDTIAKIIQDHGYLISSSDIALRYGVSTSTVQRLFKNINVDSKRLSESISIDEFKGNTGAKFQVVINDLITHQCLNIIEDRSPDILYSKIMDYPLEERLKVKHVSIDLSPLFRKMIQECFPNAQIAADKFHTVRLANDALDSVRKQLQKKLPQEQRKHFKRSRY
jgi:transposase